MNKDQYLRMVEQTGEEIDWDRIPPDSEDFPESALLYKLYHITDEIEQDWIFELLLEIDGVTIAASQRRLSAEYDKIKRKHG